MLMKKSKLKKSIILLLAVTSIILNGCAKQETDLRSSNSHLGHTGMPGSKATGGYSEDITMAEIKEAVVDMLGDNYWPDSKIDAVSLEQIYGISSDMYEDFCRTSVKRYERRYTDHHKGKKRSGRSGRKNIKGISGNEYSRL